MTTPAKQTSAQFAPLGTVSAPADWNIPSNIVLSPSVVFAHFDGSAAAGSFVPTLQILSDSGHVVAEIPQDVTVAAGSSCEATWAPFLKTAAAAGGVLPGPSPVLGFDAYAIYEAGASGNFVPPPAAKVLQVVLVGAGGGGGSGMHSNSAGTAASGGGGGGGGACYVVYLDAARMGALYPSGVPYSVGSGGAGGTAVTGLTNGNPGGNGGGTSFGLASVGGGGGGAGGTLTDGNMRGGSGGGILSAVLSGAGSPSHSITVPDGGGYAATQRGAGAWPQSTEYGGAAGGTRAASITLGTPNTGQQGGSALWGGNGGGGGGNFTNTSPANKGGAGGAAGNYISLNSGTGNGTNSPGTFAGAWVGSAGDGGDGPTGSNGNAHDGQAGSTGSGGGGGGGAATGTSGAGGVGGGGRLYIYCFG